MESTPLQPPAIIRSPSARPIREPATAPDPKVRLVTVEAAMPEISPERFLAEAEGEPRGLWARGGRWVAPRGVLAETAAAPGQDPADVARFASVWRQATSLPRPNDESGRVRLYGGFAFAADHRAEAAWAGFPAALFHLPEAELTGDQSSGTTLRVRAFAGPGDADEIEAALQARLEALRERLLWDAAGEGSPEGGAGAGGAGRVPADARLRALQRSVWQGAVTEILEAIEGGRVNKAVLARTLDVDTPDPVSAVEVVRALRAGNPNTHVFLFEPRAGRALLGAAPEAIATLRHGVFHATAVAGSVARGATDDEQAALARALLSSAKDRAEQRVVVEDMVRRLASLARDVRAEPEPHVLTLARIQHLETEIRARVESGRSVLDLVAALHPTPAVCGVPRDAALELLRHEEPFERGWYAGPVGWFTLDGDGHFVPALRTAVGGPGGWRLFAGAGIVRGSEPAAEWDETAIKFQPVLRALASAGVGIPGRPRDDE